jgi:toxin ParE1/3/4
VTEARLAPRARDELRAAARWIAQDNPDAAIVLVQAVFHAAERIGAHPEIGRERLELAPKPFRFLALTGFPYLVATNSASLRILRIVHMARDLPTILADIWDT